MVNFACNLLADGRYQAYATGLLGTFHGEPAADVDAAVKSANGVYASVEALKGQACEKLGLPAGASMAAILEAVVKSKKGKV